MKYKIRIFLLDFLATSVNNIVSLGVGVCPVLYSLDNPDPLIASNLFCKVRGYFLQISLMVSRWFISFACIDRYILASNKRRLLPFAQVHVACKCIAGIVIFWFGLASHRLVFYEVKGSLCAIISKPAAALFHTIYVLLGGGVLPTTIMIFCAYKIRKYLRVRQEKKHKNVRIQILLNHQKQQEAMDNHVMMILYVQIISYIILMTPQMGNVTYNAIMSTKTNRNIEMLAIDRMFAFLAELMMYIFPVMSFYLYTLSSPSFRSELCHAIHEILGRFSDRFQRQIGPEGSSSSVIQSHVTNLQKHAHASKTIAVISHS